MGRIRRLAYSLVVALLVFSVLSLPILSRLYGPVVYLPAYAVVSVAAGLVTWSLLSRIGESGDRRTDIAVEGRASESKDDLAEVDVDAELENLRDERG